MPISQKPPFPEVCVCVPSCSALTIRESDALRWKGGGGTPLIAALLRSLVSPRDRTKFPCQEAKHHHKRMKASMGSGGWHEWKLSSHSIHDVAEQRGGSPRGDGALPVPRYMQDNANIDREERARPSRAWRPFSLLLISMM